jgi:hypothetical protein
MVECVVIRPCFDEASSISFEWCSEVIGWLREKNISLIDLARDDAVRSKVEEAIQRENPQLIVFYNHGDTQGLLEQDGENYVIDKKNDYMLAGRELYTLACLYGADAGIDAWKKGAIAVWCYIKEFGFTTEALTEFKNFANSGIKFKLEGKTWEESLQQAKNLAKQLCQKLINEGKYISAIILQHDADALRCYTQNNPPETSTCIFRKLLIKILGPQKAWRIAK